VTGAERIEFNGQPAIGLRSPDGARVAVMRNNGIEFWDWKAGRMVTPPVRLASPVQSFCYSPDSTAPAAALCMDGRLLLIEPANGRVVAELENASEPATFDQYKRYRPPFSIARFDPTVGCWDAGTDEAVGSCGHAGGR